MSSIEDFKANHQAQEAAFAAYMAANQGYLKTWGVTKLVGQSVKGVVAPFEITYTGLMAGAHKEGAAGVRQYVNLLKNFNWNSVAVIEDIQKQVAPLKILEDQKKLTAKQKLELRNLREKERLFRSVETRVREFAGREYFKDL